MSKLKKVSSEKSSLTDEEKTKLNCVFDEIKDDIKNHRNFKTNENAKKVFVINSCEDTKESIKEKEE
jgi:hypothetical protein